MYNEVRTQSKHETIRSTSNQLLDHSANSHWNFSMDITVILSTFTRREASISSYIKSFSHIDLHVDIRR
jgi:hypothetical protein